MKSYRILDIGDTREGMRLHGDLRDRAGNMLLPKDAVLTCGTIDALRRRGIETVRVADDAVTEAQLADGREQRLARLERLFRHAGGGPAAILLRKVVHAYRQEAAA